MGGNALSLNTTVRLPKNSYDQVAQDCLTKLKARFPNNRIVAIPSYRQKADFGDLDILIESTDYDPFQAADAIGAVETVRNGPVTSVGVIVRPEIPHRDGNVFQVDLIKVDRDIFDFALNYYAWNDCGNLIGRIAHKMGMKFGHDGLWLPFREGTHLFREILVTRSFPDALSFLGFDPARHADGFHALEDVYRFVADSKYFDPDIFLLENRGHRARVRDAKRPSYTGFLKWVESTQAKANFTDWPENKRDWLPALFKAFPDTSLAWDATQGDLEVLRQVKEKFSGQRVREITGLEGPELGAFMASFGASFPDREAFDAWVVMTPQEEIDRQLHERSGAMESGCVVAPSPTQECYNRPA